LSVPAAATLPPGRSGLPLLGETLAFAKNPFGFIESRLEAHGRVFRTHVLGRPTVVIAGPEATGDFIDAEKVVRAGSMPANIEALFGGRSLPLLDGTDHRARKTLVLQAFSRQALAGYLPAMQAIVERSFAAWASAGEIRWLDAMKRLSIEVICSTIIGMEPGEEMDGLRRDYGTLTSAFAALPIDLPGTRYRAGLRARDRILRVLRRVVSERRAAPTGDGLSHMLRARTAEGVALADEDAILELHHVVIAGYIVFAELGMIVRQLTDHPEVRSRLAEEVLRLAPAGPVSLESLAAMPYLRQVIMETKRLCPIIPAIFGKARTDFQVDGLTVPAGWMVLWALLPTHTTCSRYTDPARFDPERFSPERAEDGRHPNAFVPQGAGPAIGHRCPGLDYATVLMQVFTIVLLRGYDWRLPAQRWDLVYTTTPPEPVDGLRARVAKSA
jgi:cytochrome P450